VSYPNSLLQKTVKIALEIDVGFFIFFSDFFDKIELFFLISFFLKKFSFFFLDTIKINKYTRQACKFRLKFSFIIFSFFAEFAYFVWFRRRRTAYIFLFRTKIVSF